MQTSLLAVGIAIILALVAALVGPFFINWSDYRAVFSERASRLLGTTVQVGGAVDVRLLPTPSVTLRNIEALGPSGEVRLKVREVRIELALGPLLQGEWRATQVQLSAPQLTLELDDNQVLDWKLPAAAEADALSIERFAVEDGRAVLSDAATGASLVMERLWFTGDLRSLAGPVKGEGGFTAGDTRHNFRLSIGRPTDEGARLRLAVDPADRPLSVDADGLVRMEKGSPRFEGMMTLTRLPAVVMAKGRALNSEPLRLSGRTKLTSASALFEQLEMQYGPEERALKFGGAAELKFGERIRLEAVLSARQLDIDRLVALPEGTRRLPLVALRSAMETLDEVIQPSIPVRLGISVDTLTLGGSPVQGLRADLSADGSGWEVETLEFRAPGMSQVRASGHLAWSPAGASFAGPASVAATDPKALLAWIDGGASQTGTGLGPLRVVGDLTLGGQRFGIERLRAQVDRRTLTGRIDYAFAQDNKPSRLEAEIKAADLDLDTAVGAIRAALPDARMEWPGEFALTLDLGRATLAGVEARNAKAKLQLTAGGLVVEQLAIEDLAGLALDLRGRIEDPWKAPSGSLAFDVTGTRLDGLAAWLDIQSPRAGHLVRTLAGQVAPVRLRGTLGVERLAATAAGGATARAALRIDGRAGNLRVALNGTLAGDPANWRQSLLAADARVETDDGKVLARLLGLEQTVALGTGGGLAQISLNGPISGEMQLKSRLAATGADATADGTLRWGDEGPAIRAAVAVSAADLPALRRVSARPQEPASMRLRASGSLTSERVNFGELSGSIAGSTVSGRLALGFGAPLQIDGKLDADAAHLPAVLALLAGMPPAEGGAGRALWSSQPFSAGAMDNLEGQVALTVSRATLSSGMEARQVTTRLRFLEGEIAAEEIKGVLAGGRLGGNVKISRMADGRAVDITLSALGADLAALLPGGARPPVSGQVSVQLEMKGSGRTPAALVGGLGGAGTLSVAQTDLAGLDPRVFDAVTRAIDNGADVDIARVVRVVETALANGRLRVARADAAVTVTAGQIRLGGLIAKGEGADLSVNATYDIAQNALDARLALASKSDAGGAIGRPEVFVALRGPAGAPQRSVDVSALVGWLTLRAVDLQARRLEAAEAARARDQAALSAPIPMPGSAPLAAPIIQPAAPPAAGTSAAKPLTNAGASLSAAPVAGLGAVPAPTPGAAALTPGSPAGPPLVAPAMPPVMPPDDSSMTQPQPPASPPQQASQPPTSRVRTPARNSGLPRPPAARPEPSQRTGSLPRSRSAPSASAEPAAPALAPPIDIRPLPLQRRPAAQQNGPRRDSGADARPRPPASIPDRRSTSSGNSFFDLFGATR